MFKAVRWVVAGLALQLMIGQALAQGGRGRVNQTSSVMFALQKSVQDELKLSEEQIEKLKQVGAKMRDESGGGGVGRGDPEVVRKKFAEATQAAEKDMNAILSAEQSKRLKEITLQQNGPIALNRPEVAKEVGLTDNQQAKVMEIIATHSSEMIALIQAGGGGGDREETRKKIETLRKDTNDKLLALLKDDQKKAWEKLLGEPIQPFGGNRPRNKTAQ